MLEYVAKRTGKSDIRQITESLLGSGDVGDLMETVAVFQAKRKRQRSKPTGQATIQEEREKERAKEVRNKDEESHGGSLVMKETSRERRLPSKRLESDNSDMRTMRGRFAWDSYCSTTDRNVKETKHTSKESVREERDKQRANGREWEGFVPNYRAHNRGGRFNLNSKMKFLNISPERFMAYSNFEVFSSIGAHGDDIHHVP